MQIKSRRQTEVGVGTEKEGEKTHEVGREGPDRDKKRTRKDKIVHSKGTDSKVFQFLVFVSACKTRCNLK